MKLCAARERILEDMDEKKSTGEPGEARRENDDEMDSTVSRGREQRKILELFGTIDFESRLRLQGRAEKKRS
jgi:hypothetical protein